MQRRQFLQAFGSLGASAMLSQLGVREAIAQNVIGTDDYKALVCVYLAGGNDANNTVIPVDAAYTAYANLRGALALPQNKVVPLTEAGGVLRYGLHPSLNDLASVWQAGELALLLNVGSLVRPVLASDLKHQRAERIGGLFSHPDQTRQWHSGVASTPASTGWGGRLSDLMLVKNNLAAGTGLISLAGTTQFTKSTSLPGLQLPASGGFSLRGNDGSAASTVRMNAWRQLLQIDKESALVAAAQDVTQITLDKRDLLNPILTGTTAITKEAFGGLTTGISKQLLTIAKLIEQRELLGARRQVFYVSLGGFDTHTGQLATQSSLLAQLGGALKAFNTALNAMGAGGQVTTFTTSEFSRTFRSTNGGGSDHAWGGHHLIMGGAVRGGATYGRYPTLQFSGPDDASSDGRWVPTTSVDQYAATLAQWFGVAPAALPSLLPNIANFPNQTLTFMG
jgi:uncharacterized protein (DUF1501 family)